MATTEVSRWALTSTFTMLVVGDILFAGRAGHKVPETFNTPGHRAGGSAGIPFPTSLWKAGKLMLRVAGTTDVELPRPALVASFYSLVRTEIPTQSTDWVEGQCLVNTTHLKGAASAALREWCTASRGICCVEWMPFLELRALQLYDHDGTFINIAKAIPLLASPSTTVRDVLGWQHVTINHIGFQAHCGGGGGAPEKTGFNFGLGTTPPANRNSIWNFPGHVFFPVGPQKNEFIAGKK
ncbi:hypothetical protein PF010_g6332, partial [Phytophthora fragariae]